MNKYYLSKNHENSNIKMDEFRIIMPMGLVMMGSLIRNATAIMTILSSSMKRMIDIGVKAVIFISLIFALQIILRRIPLKIWFFSICGLFFAVLHMLVFPENNRIFVQTLKTIIMTFYPCILCLKSINDYEYFYDKMVIFSKITLIINVLFVIMFISGAYLETVNMGYSMSFILPTNFFVSALINSKKKKNFFDVALFAFNFVAMLVYGSRGALVSIVFCMLIFLILSGKDVKSRRFLFDILGVILIAIALYYFDEIIKMIISFLGLIGLSSRSLEMILEESFFRNNGRFLIWDEISTRIMEHPFHMRGINADQLLQTGYYHGSNTSHNVVLEMCYSFGVLFGSIFCIILLYKIIKCFHPLKSTRDIIKLVYLFSFFPICIWSGSIWEGAWWYWICI